MSIKRNNKTIAGTYSATTTASIAPSTDRNYVTDAEKELISNLYFKPAYTITVGTGGDFATLSAAIAYVANYSAVKVTISLLNDITEPATIALNGMNSSTIIIEGNSHAVTFTTGTLAINSSTNLTIQNITINMTTNMTIYGMSSVYLSNSSFICSSTTTCALDISGVHIIHSNNCIFTTSNSTSSGGCLAIANGANFLFLGTNIINCLSCTGVILYVGSALVTLTGVLKIYGKSGCTTNAGLYLSQGSLNASYGASITLTNTYIGILATYGSKLSSNSITVTYSGVTTLYSPAKNTLGNSNSYIQVP